MPIKLKTKSPVKKTVKKPLLKKPLKPPVSIITQAELKRAYNLVTTDLFNQLVKLKEGTIYIGSRGSLGAFKKTERKIQSRIQPRGVKTKPKLNTYVYYSVRFKPSKALKAQLNEALERKYR